MHETAPQNPAGEFVSKPHYDDAYKTELIKTISDAPTTLKTLVADMPEQQLDTKYRNWTIRQIVNHLAESHMNAYVRFKWAITEENPTIKPYDESLWSELSDNRSGPIEPALMMFAGIHSKWTALLHSMSDEQFDRTYFHPEMNEHVTLRAALPMYDWHTRHHIGQIKWLIDTHQW